MSCKTPGAQAHARRKVFYTGMALALAFVSFMSVCDKSNADQIKQDHSGFRIEQVGNLSWMSGNSQLEGLDVELENHYLRLANVDLLPTGKETLIDRVEFPSLYFKKKFLFLKWTDRIDNLLCDLNSHVCTRSRNAYMNAEPDTSRHVMGHAFSSLVRTRWSLSAGDTISFPDVKVFPAYNWVEHDFKPGSGANIRDSYRSIASGCYTGIARETGFEFSFDLVNSGKELIANESMFCPRWILNRNMNWLMYTAASRHMQDYPVKLGNNDRASIVNSIGGLYRHVEKVSRELEIAGREGKNETAWSSLDNLLSDLSYSKFDYPEQIQLPVLAFKADQWVYQRLMRPLEFSGTDRWKEHVSDLTLNERLAFLNSTGYSHSVLDLREPLFADSVLEKLLETTSDFSELFERKDSGWIFHSMARQAGNIQDRSILSKPIREYPGKTGPGVF